MNETPKCPMGHEMELIEVATGGWRYACKKCAMSYKTGKKAASGWLSPIRSRKDLAFKAAMMLATEPEMRPLTLEEVRAHCAKGRDAEPLWTEFREECAISRWIFAVIPPDVFDRPVLSEWIATNRSEKYGKEWRCWPRKPTPEQMAATEWEE